MAEQLAGFQFAKPFDVTNPVSTDKRYGKFNGSTTVPFANVAEAKDLVKLPLRFQGLQCVIANGASVSLYWWRDGIADANLVLLQTDVNLTDYVQKEAGKGLSTNDFTNSYKNTLDNFLSSVMTLVVSGLSSVQGSLLNTDNLVTILSKLKYFYDNISLFVRNALLSGLSTANTATISENDTVVGALGKAQAQLNKKVDKDGTKVLSTEDYTTAEKNKLAGIYKEYNLIFVAPYNGIGPEYFKAAAKIKSVMLFGATSFQYSIDNGLSYLTPTLPLAADTFINIPAGKWVRWRIAFAANSTNATAFIEFV